MTRTTESRRKRREHMKNPTWQERMVYQRNVGRVHQLPMEIVRREEARAAGKPARHPVTKRFLPIKALKAQYDRVMTAVFGNGQGRQSATA